MPDDYVNVKIPRSLYEEISKRVEESGGDFRDVEDYVTFILTEVIREEDEEPAYTPEEEEEIKRRLRQLGYL